MKFWQLTFLAAMITAAPHIPESLALFCTVLFAALMFLYMAFDL